jgi:hypothetical protein
LLLSLGIDNFQEEESEENEETEKYSEETEKELVSLPDYKKSANFVSKYHLFIGKIQD